MCSSLPSSDRAFITSDIRYRNIPLNSFLPRFNVLDFPELRWWCCVVSNFDHIRNSQNSFVGTHASVNIAYWLPEAALCFLVQRRITDAQCASHCPSCTLTWFKTCVLPNSRCRALHSKSSMAKGQPALEFPLYTPSFYRWGTWAIRRCALPEQVATITWSRIPTLAEQHTYVHNGHFAIWHFALLSQASYTYNSL